MQKSIFFLTLFVFLLSCSDSNKPDSNTENTEENVGGVSFLNIEDGDTLSSPFDLEMGVEGMEVEPKGEINQGFGHHHLLINDDFTKEGITIIADSTHIHYGGGQTTDSLALDPGEYKLTLQFGDGFHTSYGEAWSKSVNVTVQ